MPVTYLENETYRTSDNDQLVDKWQTLRGKREQVAYSKIRLNELKKKGKNTFILINMNKRKERWEREIILEF